MKSSTKRITISALWVSDSPVCPDTLMSWTAPCRQSSRRRLSMTRWGTKKVSAEEIILTAAIAWPRTWKGTVQVNCRGISDCVQRSRTFPLITISTHWAGFYWKSVNLIGSLIIFYLTIRLWARDLYRVIVNEGAAQVNNLIVSHNLIVLVYIY